MVRAKMKALLKACVLGLFLWPRIEEVYMSNVEHFLKATGYGLRLWPGLWLKIMHPCRWTELWLRMMDPPQEILQSSKTRKQILAKSAGQMKATNSWTKTKTVF